MLSNEGLSCLQLTFQIIIIIVVVIIINNNKLLYVNTAQEKAKVAKC